VSKERDKEPVKEKRKEPVKAPPGLLLLAWLVPGLGHWILGRRRRALVFSLAVCCAFATGILIDGEVGYPRQDSPFSWLATLACSGSGILYIARMIWLNGFDLLSSFPFDLQGGGDTMAAGFAYGNTFFYTSGLMNLLTVLDVSDIFRGEKD
jgi:hypothetical protein